MEREATAAIEIERPVARATLAEFDFYRCITSHGGCGRIITRDEMAAGFESGQPCPCGHLKFSPINLPWYGWLFPRVWKFAYFRLRGLA